MIRGPFSLADLAQSVSQQPVRDIDATTELCFLQQA
jgi:hypothetical protein